MVATVGEEDLAPRCAVHDVMPAVGFVAPRRSSHQDLLPLSHSRESLRWFRIPDDFSWHRGLTPSSLSRGLARDSYSVALLDSRAMLETTVELSISSVPLAGLLEFAGFAGSSGAAWR